MQRTEHLDTFTC